MKQIVICFTCGKPVGLYKSYLAKVSKSVEMMGQIMSTKPTKVRICGNCAREAGYSVGVKRPRKPQPVEENLLAQTHGNTDESKRSSQ